MKKARVWLISILLILPCSVFGCTSLDNGKDDTVLTTLSTTSTANTTTSHTTSESHSATQATTTLTTVNTTVLSTTSESYFTVQTSIKGKVTILKSETEMLAWIQNSDFADCTFKQTLQQLNLEHLLTVHSISDAFTLERIEIHHNYTNIDYYFVDEKNEEIYFNIELPAENIPEDYLKTQIESINQANQKKYESCPLIYVGDDVFILGKSRQTYIRNRGIARQRGSCIVDLIYALFVTDIDGFPVQCNWCGSLSQPSLDSEFLLNHFEFSYIRNQMIV